MRVCVSVHRKHHLRVWDTNTRMARANQHVCTFVIVLVASSRILDFQIKIASKRLGEEGGAGGGSCADKIDSIEYQA